MYVTKGFLQDFNWWCNNAHLFNGILYLKRDVPMNNTLLVYENQKGFVSDSNYGNIFGFFKLSDCDYIERFSFLDGYVILVPPCCMDKPSTKELIGVWCSMVDWGPGWESAIMDIFVSKMNTFYSLTKGHSHCKCNIPLIRDIFDLLTKYDISINVFCIKELFKLQES